MPKEWKDCVKKVKSQGKSESRAYAICTAAFMKKHGMTPAEADKRGKLEDEDLLRKLNAVDDLFLNLAPEDMEAMTEDDEHELAEIVEMSIDGGFSLVWVPPTKRKEHPDSHFFWPEERKFPYRNQDGSVNGESVMAAWRLANGERTKKKAPSNVISRIRPKYEACLQRNKTAEDVVDFVRKFDLPSKICFTISEDVVSLCDEVMFNEKTKVVNIEVLKLGKFEHPGYGELDFTPKVFKSFIKNFEGGVPQEHIAYDFRHRPDWGAASWLQKLTAKGGSLWATVELTRRGFEALKQKEFLYFSTEYVDDYTDASGKKFGPTILGGGLTNRPFIKGMAPAVLSEDGEIVLSPVKVDEKNNNFGKEDKGEMLKKILEDLNKLKGQLKKLTEGKDADKADEETKELIKTIKGQIKAFEDQAKKLDEDAKKLKEAEEAKKLKEAEEAKKLKDKEGNDDADAKKLQEENKKLMDELQEKNKKLTGEVTILTESMTKLLKAREGDTRRLYEQDVEAFAKKLEENGFWPATVETVKALMLAAPDEDHVSITLSEKVEGEDKPKEVKLALKDVIQRVLESVPEENRIDMEELSQQHNRQESKGKGMTVKEIEKYAEENKLSYKDALVKLSDEGKVVLE